MRVSTTIQVDGYSLDAQKARMKAFAEYNDYKIVGEYEDAGKSGKSIEGRLEFNRMMEDIKSGKDGVSYVLVFKLSRFGRNAAHHREALPLRQKKMISDESAGCLQAVAFVKEIAHMSACLPQLLHRLERKILCILRDSSTRCLHNISSCCGPLYSFSGAKPSGVRIQISRNPQDRARFRSCSCAYPTFSTV